MSTDTSTNRLIINKLSKAQYEAISSPSDTELYLTPDTTAQDISDAVSTHNSSASAHSTLLNAKQDTLISGTNIKTINSNSILGSGNLELNGLPSQSGQSGKYLTTDGTTASWATPKISDLTDDTATNPIDQAESVKDIKTTNANKFWTGTKAEYEAIATKDSNTFYNITDDTDITLSLLQTIYPVGSIYITTNSTCPLASLFGTWTLVGADRVLQGAGIRGAVGTTVEESLPSHTHDEYFVFSAGSRQISPTYNGTSSSGGIKSITQSLTNVSYPDDGTLQTGKPSSSTYQDDAPVQQDAYLVNIYRRTA